jgi:hypothetical protein
VIHSKCTTTGENLGARRGGRLGVFRAKVIESRQRCERMGLVYHGALFP